MKMKLFQVSFCEITIIIKLSRCKCFGTKHCNLYFDFFTCSGLILLYIIIASTKTQPLISAVVMEEPIWVKKEFRTVSNLINAIHFVNYLVCKGFIAIP